MIVNHRIKNLRKSIKTEYLVAIAIILGVMLLGALFQNFSSVAHSDHAPALSWKILSMLDYQSGEMPPILERLERKQVRIAGYIVPLDDDSEAISEFLLVPYEGACIHAPPPPPNQMIQVRMVKPIQFTWKPVWVEGQFNVIESKSPYGKVLFELVGKNVTSFDGSKHEQSAMGFDL